MPNCKFCGEPITSGVVIHSDCIYRQAEKFYAEFSRLLDDLEPTPELQEKIEQEAQRFLKQFKP